MLLFYRQLDLLNRLYILNYYNLQLLEYPFISEVPKDSLELCIRPLFNFDLHDQVLLVSSFSTRKIKFIIDKIFFEILRNNSEISVNSTVLRKLVKYFLPRDFKQLVNNRNKTTNLHDKYILNALQTHQAIDIFYHFIHVIFKSLHDTLEIDILERFVVDYQLDSEIVKIVEAFPLHQLLTHVINQYFPYINTLSKDKK